jgi:hypothetical protein
MAVVIKTEPTPRALADARQSIVRRLMTYGAERRRLEQRLAVIGELEKEFQELLREVDNREQPSLIKEDLSTNGFPHEPYNNAVVKELLQRAIKSGPKTLDELVRISHQAGIDFGEKSPARVIHFNLVNLKNSKTVDRDGELWVVADDDKE